MNQKLYKLLMILQGILWIAMAIQSAFSDTAVYPIIMLLMVLNGILYILLAFPDIRTPFFKLAVIAFLGVNTVLSVTDQLGFFDYLVLVWNIALLVLVFTIVLPRRQG